MRRAGIALAAALLPAAAWGAGDADQLPTIIVTGRVPPDAATERIYGTLQLDSTWLDAAPERRLDEALRSVPGFSLFRRTGSTSAHPTSQGISLRALGPNGAGRTLVLVDDIPVNDPFGGWVYWSRLPTAAVASVAVTEGSGAGPWGNQALDGVIRITTKPLQGGEVRAGSNGLAEGTAGAAAGGVSVLAHASRSDGSYLVRSDQRGPIDTQAGWDDAWVDVKAQGDAGPLALAGTLSAFHEHRGNGTPLQENGTDALEGSLRLADEDGPLGLPWHGTLYLRRYVFRNRFSSVNATRTAETPALDQYRVPATAAGGSLSTIVEEGGGRRTVLGADLRWAEGATHERFQPVAGVFQRDRDAGGDQVVGGVYAEQTWPLTPVVDLHGGVRLDGWSTGDGHRVERSIQTGAVTRNDHYDDRGGVLPTARLGADWRPLSDWTLRAAAYTGFRLPTINELYRPYRVGNDIIEANAQLKPERMVGAEAGVTWAPAHGPTVSLTAYHDGVTDAVDNVLITTKPGTVPGFGVVVPAGGTFAQRRNLDRVRAEGAEMRATWALDPTLDATLGYLWSRSTVLRADGFAALVGKRLAQSPLHTGTADLTWTPSSAFTTALRVKASGQQYEDGLNSRSLAPTVTVDLSGTWRISDYLAVFATAENLFDRTVESGRRIDGLVAIAPGRIISGGVRVDW
ncbi:outer membrane receptor for ferrienterochelin and colicin [Nitrospirillum amazonense]|uniref:Outer membrane receptor for ferrienterochelin and colicin n=1 Tax=Nitrospirillum amazonense TaxID=28077 RepID=A0A560KH28_9PROT|nr:TonB-dependent receptor [Nitrospirillum amazonense]TWB82379.1 outer membrane receptor for ferrienterochelin and colicin [Nitrospirillum amazonense]